MMDCAALRASWAASVCESGSLSLAALLRTVSVSLGYWRGRACPGCGFTSDSRASLVGLGNTGLMLGAAMPSDSGLGGLCESLPLLVAHTLPNTSCPCSRTADLRIGPLDIRSSADVGCTTVIHVGAEALYVTVSPDVVILTAPPAAMAQIRYSPGAML